MGIIVRRVEPGEKIVEIPHNFDHPFVRVEAKDGAWPFWQAPKGFDFGPLLQVYSDRVLIEFPRTEGVEMLTITVTGSDDAGSN